jgi:hypothetical protein
MSRAIVPRYKEKELPALFANNQRQSEFANLDSFAFHFVTLQGFARRLAPPLVCYDTRKEIISATCE